MPPCYAPYYVIVEQAAANSASFWTAPNIFACISALAACASVYYVRMGVNTWKEQLKGTARIELARKLLEALYNLRGCYLHSRKMSLSSPPVTHDKEGKKLSDGESRQTICEDVLDRGASVYEAFNKADALIYEGQFVFGEEVNELFEPIREVIGYHRHCTKNYVYLDDLMEKQSLESYEEEELSRSENFLFNPWRGDHLPKLDTSIKDIEKYLRPFYFA